MNISENTPVNPCNEETQKNDDAISLLSEDIGLGRNDDSDNVKICELSMRKKEKDCTKKNGDGIDSKLGFDIKNVLTHAYLPVCIEKMKEGEYVYKWNSNNIFQKKTLKFIYLDVNNYCIRWNSKKKKLKENKNPSLYIWDIIEILDGSESSFFKKKEEEKNLSIEIISIHRNLRITFLDIQRWKMWLFGLMYYQYKLVNKGSGKKKMKPFIYESKKLYDNYIISGLKDINALTLSQLYIILRSLNIYLNMKILYHYFSIYKNKGTVNYLGFTKILEHIFSNNHITIHFNMYKDKNCSYIGNRNFIEFLIDVQCEGKCEERIFSAHEMTHRLFINEGLASLQICRKEVHILKSPGKTLNKSFTSGNVGTCVDEVYDEKVSNSQMDYMKRGNENVKNVEVNSECNTHQMKGKNKRDRKIEHTRNSIDTYEKGADITPVNSRRHNFDNYEWEGTFMKNMDKDNVSENDIHFNMNNLHNAFLLSDNFMYNDEDYITILNILRSKLSFNNTQTEKNNVCTCVRSDGPYYNDDFSENYGSKNVNCKYHDNSNTHINENMDRGDSCRRHFHNKVDKNNHEDEKNIESMGNKREEDDNDDDEKKRNISWKDGNMENKSYYIRAIVIYKLLNTIKKYNIPFVIINEDKHYLTQIGLVYFLLSKDNSVMCPEYSKVYQNMNLPLCNYWINSSHNTYLGRKQIFSSSNIEQYIYILIDGCRCVEFDCYYFNKNIVVYHGFYGYKLTSSILFCDTLIACKMFGFTTSPFPIILSLEIHCKNKHKNLIAKILIYILGNQLYIPKSRDEINNITPNNCMNKFLVKYKHFDNNENSGFYFIFEGLQSVMYDELGYISDIVEDDPYDETEEQNHNNNEGSGYDNSGCDDEVSSYDNFGYDDDNRLEILQDIHHKDVGSDVSGSKDEDVEKQDDNYTIKSIQKKGYIQERKKRSISISRLCNDSDVVEKDQRGEDPTTNTRDNPQVVKSSKFSKHKKGKKNISSSEYNDMRKIRQNGVNKEYMEEKDDSLLVDTQKREKKNDKEGEKKTVQKNHVENQSLKSNNILNEYSCLKGYPFQNFCENRTYNEICSISENKFIKLIKKNEEEIIKYNQKTLTRVYPSGTRLASTNFNPLIFWSAGIQFVALNYQYNGLSMLLNKGRFLENGGKHSGYILKPELLRFNEKNDYNILHLNLQILSLHQINLLFSIKNKYQEKKLKKKLFKMDMIQRIQTHKKINKKMKNFKELQKLEKEKKKFFFSDVQSDDNKKKKYISHEFLMKKFNDNDNDVNHIHNKCLNVEEKYEDMLSEYKSFLLCSSLSHSSSFNSCSSNATTSNNTTTDSNKNNSSKSKNKSFYQTFEELKKANNLFFYLYVTISIHGYNEQKYYFKTEIAKVNFYDLNYCWPKPSNFEMKILYPSLALIVFELKTYDTVKSELIACACFPVKCLREGIRFVPLCDKYLKDIKGSGILVNLKIGTNGS